MHSKTVWNQLMQNAENVGIYFSVNGKILSDKVETKSGEPYGHAIQHGGHYEFWKALVPQSGVEGIFKSDGYDLHPRGRVVYLKEEKIYRIYHDSCLGKSDLTAIKHHFGLESADTECERDEHYQCGKCNPLYNEDD